MFMFSLNAAPSVTQRLASWYEGSVIKELLDYFWDTYFTVHLHAYEHFHFGDGAAESMRAAVFALAIALFVASVIAVCNRKWIGAFVRTLVEREVHSPDAAQTLFQLGFFRSVLVRHELKYGTQLKGLVICREKEASSGVSQEVRQTAQTGSDPTEQGSAEIPAKSADVPLNSPLSDAETDVRDFAQTKGEGSAEKASQKADQAFVLDFKTAHFYIPATERATAQVRYEKKGFGWLWLILTAVVAVVLAAAICTLLPDLLQLADNIISMTSPQ